MTTKTPITALCGFLGSGKTTLLRRWMHQDALRDSAIIVHDFSEFGLDAELLAGDESNPVPGLLTGRVAALHGSHARELLHDSVGKVLEEISTQQPSPPAVLCESTGAARPWPLIEALTQDDRFYLRHFIVTVDALNLHRDFSDGRVLTGEVDPTADPALLRAAEVLAEQILFASVIIVTKIDAVPKAVVDAQVQTLRKLQPKAAVGLSSYAGLLPSQLEGTPAPKLTEMKAWAERFGLAGRAPTPSSMTSRVLRDRRPFHPQRLFDACQNALGTGLYRTKGFLWMVSRAPHLLLWQQSGSQIALEVRGYWRVEAMQDSELWSEEVESLKSRGDMHPVFGDRRNELTLIGEQASCQAFYEALEGALCTDEEVDAWQAGASFEDPWPKTLRRFEF